MIGPALVRLAQDAASDAGSSEAWRRRFFDGGGGADPGEAAARADRILGLRDYAQDPRGDRTASDSWIGRTMRRIVDWLDGISDAIADWLRRLFGGDDATAGGAGVPGGSSIDWQALTQTLVIAALVVAILLVALLVARRFRGRARERVAPAAASVTSRVAELRALAREAAARGDWIEALRLEFFALVVGLGERGDLEYRDAWTNRELLDRGEPRPEVSRALSPMVGRLDEHSFGRRPSGPDEVREFQLVCERLLEAHA